MNYLNLISTIEPDEGKPYRWESGDQLDNTTYQNFASGQPTMEFLPGGCGRILTGKWDILSIIYIYKFRQCTVLRKWKQKMRID